MGTITVMFVSDVGAQQERAKTFYQSEYDELIMWSFTWCCLIV